jgi:hypothetical protein
MFYIGVWVGAANIYRYSLLRFGDSDLLFTEQSFLCLNAARQNLNGMVSCMSSFNYYVDLTNSLLALKQACCITARVKTIYHAAPCTGFVIGGTACR